MRKKKTDLRSWVKCWKIKEIIWSKNEKKIIIIIIDIKWTSTNQTNKYIWRRNLQSVDYWVHVKEYSQTNKKCKVKTIKLHPRRKGNLGHCVWTSQGKMTQREVSHWRDGCHKLPSKQTDSIIFPDGMWAGPYNLCWYNIWHNLRQWAWFWLFL